MSTPLALIEVALSDGSWKWKSVQTSYNAKGARARRVIFIRRPTDEERQAVEASLLHPDAVGCYQLENLLQTA